MRTLVIKTGGKVSCDTTGLDRLRKEIAVASKARVEIGIIGNNSRTDGLSNAEIGLKHEFGVVHELLPERSFLRMPLITKLPGAIKGAGVMAWRKAIVEKGVLYALKSLGILGETIVMDAFATGGFGKWKKLSPRTIWLKKSDRILIDTAEMRQSINSRVVASSP